MKRRRLLQLAPAALLGNAAHAAQPPADVRARAQTQVRLRRPLPRSGDTLPAIGLGTWLTFDIPEGDAAQIAAREQVLQRFFAAGGGMIDSSPMYGRAEWWLGELMRSAPPPPGRLFAATKVWTPFDALGARQFEQSLKLWRLPRLDVLLVHNLLNWRAHWQSLQAWKEAGRVRYIGASTSHGRAHEEVAHLLRSEPLDVLQITYNLADRSAEPLLDLAAERGVAVVINRPLDGGRLFDAVAGRGLPPWAAEIDCEHWATFFLKWVVAHPAVTCAIPATRNPDHLEQNMAAGLGRLPDAAMRARMLALWSGR
jgi:diketogulonate reductase-like aldo/keto reductase